MEKLRIFILVKDKLRTLENEEKLEVYQKNFLEVKKDNLSRSTEFYQDYSKVS